MAQIGIDKLAAKLNLTKSRLYQLFAEGMPKNSRGKYDLEKCLLWYSRHLQESVRRREFARDRERERLTKVKADLGELELAEKRGQLIPVSYHREILTTLCMSIRQRFLILPPRIAPQLEGENRSTIKTKLDQAIRGALTALSVAETERGNDLSQSGSPAPARQGRLPRRKSARTTHKTHHKRLGRRKKSPAKRHKRPPRKVGH